MTLINRHSRCSLCGELVHDSSGRKIVTHRHFLRNARHELFKFSGRAMHEDCYLNDPLHVHAEQFVKRRKAALSDKTCAVCGELVASDKFSLDFVTDDTTDPAHEFNFLVAHSYHLREWPRFDEMVRAVTTFEDSTKYEGPAIVPASFRTR